MKASANPRHTLTHPLFWAALGLLLLNDHILKQARALPGAITGKLSDFAGLLVAPVLLAALLRARGRLGRMAVFACVAGVFAAIKLSRPLADVLEAITAYTPLPWRLWCDPTDLVALSVLPLAWWLAGREGNPALGPRLISCLRAAGLVLGIFACAATSSEVEEYRGTAFLFNETMRPQRLRLYRLQTPLDCTRSLDDPAAWPGPDAFVLEACPTLASRDILLLDRGWRALGTDQVIAEEFTAYDAGPSSPTCDAVLVQAEGLRPVVVSWNGVNTIVFTGVNWFGDHPNDDHGVILERAGERLFIKSTSLLRVLPAGFDPAPADCPNGER